MNAERKMQKCRQKPLSRCPVVPWSSQPSSLLHWLRPVFVRRGGLRLCVLRSAFRLSSPLLSRQRAPLRKTGWLHCVRQRGRLRKICPAVPWSCGLVSVGRRGDPSRFARLSFQPSSLLHWLRPVFAALRLCVLRSTFCVLRSDFPPTAALGESGVNLYQRAPLRKSGWLHRVRQRGGVRKMSKGKG